MAYLIIIFLVLIAFVAGILAGAGMEHNAILEQYNLIKRKPSRE